MDIPFHQLSHTALTNLITDYVSATDDNGADIPLQKKIDSVLSQLRSGDAVITYDEASQTSYIRPAAPSGL